MPQAQLYEFGAGTCSRRWSSKSDIKVMRSTALSNWVRSACWAIAELSRHALLQDWRHRRVTLGIEPVKEPLCENHVILGAWVPPSNLQSRSYLDQFYLRRRAALLKLPDGNAR